MSAQAGAMKLLKWLHICIQVDKEIPMDAIYADYSISMSEFKKNPAQVLRTAGEKPVAVLNHNRPAFYMVTPKLFEALVEELADRDLVSLARQRLSSKDTATEVDIDSL